MRNAGKPRALKIISGTDQPCRRVEVEVDLPKLTEAPPPPDWLPNAHAVKEWNHHAPILVQSGVLSTAMVTSMGMLCAVAGKVISIWAAGETPTTHLLAQYRGLAAEFGLTPMSCGRIKTGGKGSKKNPFEGFKKPG